MTQSLKGVQRPYQALLVITFDEMGTFYLVYFFV